MATVVRDRHVRAFRATDEFALETYRVSRSLDTRADRGLVDEIRLAAVRSGGAVAAASAARRGGPVERRLLERARSRLLAGRYYLYVARRVGLLDVRGYRGLTVRQDVALREIEQLLGAADPPRPP